MNNNANCNDINFANLVTNNVLDKDMITISNYIERTLSMITGKDSTLSVCTLIMIALYIYGDMPTQRIADVMYLAPNNVASKASQLKKEGKVTKHGIYFHLTDKSRSEVEALDTMIKTNFGNMKRQDAILLYNSYLMLVIPFMSVEDRPSLLYLVSLATVAFDTICRDVFGGKAKYSRISYLYYNEIFKEMDYSKFAALLPKSVQNIQIQCFKLADDGYITIDKQRSNQKLPPITITEKGREALLASLHKSNKRTAVMMFHLGRPGKTYLPKSFEGITKIAVKTMQSEAMKRLL